MKAIIENTWDGYQVSVVDDSYDENSPWQPERVTSIPATGQRHAELLQKFANEIINEKTI